MNYSFHPNLIIRNPRNPFNTDFNQDFFYKKIQHDDFLEAIYLASPSLYDACIRWKEGKITDKKELQKILFSLAKYASRMSSRCTPFGLFAGVSTAQWGEKTEVSIIDTPTRHTRLDMHFLCALGQKLALLPSVRERLRYFPNSSIYTLNDDIRYIEYLYKNGTRIHQISSVVQNEFIDKIIDLAQSGADFSTLTNALVDDEISQEEAAEFINELIDSQILVSELEPAITGEEFTNQLIEILDRINDDDNEEIGFFSNSLKDIQEKLTRIDSQKTNEIQQYKEIIELIKPLGVSFEENRLFQTDMVTSLSEDARINQQIQQEIEQTISQLSNLNKKQANANLSSFAKRFYDRYEDKEIPLQIALDTEIGIGYLDKNVGDFTPLIEGVILPQSAEKEISIKWNKAQEQLFRKLRDANEQKLTEIEFSTEELPKNPDVWRDLPPSISVMFRILNETDILLESAGGSSAANLLGRFAHADSQIKKMVREITAEEQYHNEDIIFAEIIHLPESRTGNILLHPTFRGYEIPFLAKSSLDTEHQLSLNDLLISVRNNHVFLRSKRLNKIVIPRLSNAHNYSYNALPVYQFLCDLQNQGKQPGIGFDWGAMANQYKFLPRVRIKNVIVSVATWKLNKQDTEALTKAKNEETEQYFKDFAKKWHLPRYFVLAESDNELLIDTENELLVKTFIDAIKNRSTITLKEVLLNQSTGIKDKNNQLFSNQIIAALVRKEACISANLSHKKTPQTQRSFSVGSEWLYFKIYCGTKTADKIIQEAIEPIVREAHAKELIDKWFFIRYNDPHFHLRVRFHLADLSKIGDLLSIFHREMALMEANGLVWKIQTDTYQRELERYGDTTITLAESLFSEDSFSILKFLSATNGDEREQIRWIFGLKSIDTLLGAFGYDVEQKLQLLNHLKENFAKEFGMEQNLKSQLDKRYRDYRPMIESFEENFPELIAILSERSEAITPIVENIRLLKQDNALEVSLDNLLNSYIHMVVNRLITSNPRMHEMMMYDFLYRQYQSTLARMKKMMV